MSCQAGKDAIEIFREAASMTSGGKKIMKLELELDRTKFTMDARAEDSEPGSLNLEADLDRSPQFVAAFLRANQLSITNDVEPRWEVSLDGADRKGFLDRCERLSRLADSAQ